MRYLTNGLHIRMIWFFRGISRVAKVHIPGRNKIFKLNTTPKTLFRHMLFQNKIYMFPSLPFNTHGIKDMQFSGEDVTHIPSYVTETNGHALYHVFTTKITTIIFIYLKPQKEPANIFDLQIVTLIISNFVPVAMLSKVILYKRDFRSTLELYNWLTALPVLNEYYMYCLCARVGAMLTFN